MGFLEGSQNKSVDDQPLDVSVYGVLSCAKYKRMVFRCSIHKNTPSSIIVCSILQLKSLVQRIFVALEEVALGMQRSEQDRQIEIGGFQSPAISVEGSE